MARKLPPLGVLSIHVALTGGAVTPESRPVVAEEIATERAVGIREATGAPIFIVHISSERAMRAAERGQARGLPVFTEVRFLYLHLTKERFDEPNGAIYTGDPPLREKSDVA